MRTLLVHIEIWIINEIGFNETIAIETNLETEEEKKIFFWLIGMQIGLKI